MIKTWTITGFAKQNRLSRSTVWRWATQKKFNKYLKMYDAKPIKTDDGKVIIEQVKGV